MTLFSFTPTLSFDSDTNAVSVLLEPSFDAPELTPEGIDTLLETASYQTYFLIQDGIDELLITDQTVRSQGQKVFEVLLSKIEKNKEADLTEEAPMLQYSPEQIFSMLGRELQPIVIAEKRDGQLEIEASDQDLKAFITLHKPYGGSPITREDIDRKILELAITAPLNDDVVKDALSKGECTKLLLATGNKPQKGKDSWFEKLVNDRFSSAPKIDEKGNANYRDVNEFVVVDAHTPLMRRHPPSNGKNGGDIFGKMIPSPMGDTLPFSTDIIGASVSPDDPDLLISTLKGHPILGHRGISIDNVLVLKNVSLASGNIDFDGSICVEEDVADGTRIKAAGDVTVKGVVGKSVIEAEGNVFISQGFIGGTSAHDNKPDTEDFKAVIIAKGAVSAKFVSHAKIIAGDDINIAEYASHCELNATHQIQLGYPQGKGNLMGGKIQAFKLVSAKTLGSTGGTPTQITVGAPAETIIDLRRVTQVLHKKQVQGCELFDEIRKLTIRAKVAGLTPQTKEIIEKYKAQQKQLDAEILELNQQEQVIKQLLIRSKKARITSSYKVWPNVSVSILSASHTTKEEMSASRFFFESRRIQIKH